VWRNWGRSQKVKPVRVERPKSAGAVQRAVSAALSNGLRIKAIGAGHSFSGIALAPDVQLDLDDLTGIVAIDARRSQVTMAAGTRLYDVPRLLAPHGLALENMGDIDRQSIAGATSTGTHGTGAGFGGLSTQIAGMTLVTGTGELLKVSADENAELLPAIRLGLGALGIAVDVTIQCRPAYLLHALEQPEPLDDVLAGFLERSRGEDHFEFYWFPHTLTALTMTNTRLPLGDQRRPLGRAGRWISDELLANGLYRVVCGAGNVAPAIIPRFNRLAQRVTGNREFTDVSHRVFVTSRTVRFREQEYALPLAAVPEAVRAVKEMIEVRDWRISFPIEVRSAAADDIWLSTAYGRETGYIAVHRYFREDPHEYFREVEAIMAAHDGRPHWGKMHTQDASALASLYPRFDEFRVVRDRLDPQRAFANPYLQQVLGD
jgi:FAD-linked oxidoreductase